MRAGPLLLLLAVAAPAWGVPRFAVRTGLPCGSCHVSPTGGGMRTPFGRNVFARQWLARLPYPKALFEAPTVELGEHVSLGADLRGTYLYTKSPRPELADTSSFALMQSDLYVAIDAPPYLGFYLDRGVYGGFEAYALLRPRGPAAARDLVIKVGRFIVPFGLRDVNHSTYVREGIGLGPTDRDSGVELDIMSSTRGTLALAITNGTYGDAFLDAGGTTNAKPYDFAASLRATTQPRLGPLRLLLSLSGMVNLNAAQQNPLFAPALFLGRQSSHIRDGVDELRVDVAAGLSLGRLGYRAELVGIHDAFSAEDLRSLTGYASHQELAVTAAKGLDLLATYEFADSDLEFKRGRIERVGIGFEWFVVPNLELSLTARHSFGKADFLIGARDDVTAFAHLYL